MPTIYPPKLRARGQKAFRKFHAWSGEYINPISVIFGVIGLIVSAFAFVPVDKLFNDEPDILGIWFQNYQYPNGPIIVEIIGTTEYLKNHSYNFVGKMKLRMASSQKEFSVVYNMDGTGIWQADSESIVVKLTNMKSRVVSISDNGKKVKPENIEYLLHEKLPTIESITPMGRSGEFRILGLSKDSLSVETNSLEGEKIQFTMTKQEHPFTRWASNASPAINNMPTVAILNY